MNIQKIKTKLNTKVSDKTAWVALGTLTVILIVVIVSCFNKTNKIEENLANEATNTAVDNSTQTKPVTTTKPVVKMSYANALNFYKDRRIQLDEKCQATPASMTFKNGTTIMIDNRSKLARKINVNGVYTVGAYDYITVKLTSSTLPKTVLVDCGISQNVATILIQK